jgi:Flp pilus assembly protein TadD
VAKGEDLPAAFKRIFNEEPKALEPDLARYAQRQLTYTRLMRKSAAVTPPMKIEILAPSADDLLLLQAAMRVGVRPERRPALLAQIRTVAAKHDDDFAKRVLAQAEALYGDGETADRLLDAILAVSPNDAQALYLKGMRLLVEARRDRGKGVVLARQAQGWFGKAHKADPDHFQTLTRYVEAMSMTSAPTENTVEVLLLAHKLAPQVAEITLNAARQLMARNHYEEATELIAPLASDPHDTRLAEAARRLQARAQARQKAETPAEAEAAEQE